MTDSSRFKAADEFILNKGARKLIKTVNDLNSYIK